MRRSEPKEKIWRRSRRYRSERSAGRNCSSSRPRPNWRDWKSRPARRGQKGKEPSAEKAIRRCQGTPKPKPVDPKQIKAGYQKAIELAPRAVEQMERAVKALKQKDPQAAYPPAEEARKILEEIQKAQPKNEQQDQKKQDQKKQDQKKNEEQQKQDQKDQTEERRSRRKSKQKDEQQKKDQEKKKQEEPKKSDEQKQEQQEKQPQPQISRDQIEEALRKVRERQQEKRERDRKMKARVFGRVPVEKDW